MSWNHRIYFDGEVYGIHETHYNENGKPYAITEEPITISADTIEGLEWQLNKIKKCFEKPVLTKDDFKNE